MIPTLLLSIALSCGDSLSKVETRNPPYIRGIVTGVTSPRDDSGNRIVGPILVEADPKVSTFGANGNSPKAYITLVDARNVSLRSGKCVTASGLRVGQLVSVWIIGIVQDSHPEQVQATYIIIERK